MCVCGSKGHSFIKASNGRKASLEVETYFPGSLIIHSLDTAMAMAVSSLMRQNVIWENETNYRQERHMYNVTRILLDYLPQDSLPEDKSRLECL